MNVSRSFFSVRLTAWVATLSGGFSFCPVHAQVSNVTVPVPGQIVPESSNGIPQLFFDARTTGFTRDGKQQIFDGDVIAIGPKSIITADRVVIDQEKKALIAEGHVVVLAADQILTGDRIELATETGDFKITGARMIVNDKVESEKIAKDVLGFSAPELSFEAEREARLDEVSKRKDVVKESVRRKAKLGQGASDGDVSDYSRLLQQEDMIRSQENPAFAQMTESRRNNLRKRRDFWETSRVSERVRLDSTRQSYFRLEGDELIKTNGNDFEAKHSLWTPCKCDKDEAPAWGFRASSTFAQMGGYATFYDAMLEVKGVPVLYLPWLMLPIKDRRQSGLLMPSFTDDVVSGSGYSQPLFIDLGRNRDMTLKGDVFERRGLRAGAEVRWKKSEYSGLQINVEGMRDKVWLRQRSSRNELSKMFTDGLATARKQDPGTPAQDIGSLSGRDYMARRLAQRDWWETNAPECLSNDLIERRACEADVLGSLRPPSNSNRGLARWRASERLSERFSFITSGEIYSDRQYNSDVYISDATQPGFDTGNGEWSINPIRSRLNYDGSGYFLGIGSYIGDSTMLNDRFEGYQTPVATHLKTRWYLLKPDGLPIYGRATMDNYRVSFDSGSKSDMESAADWLPGGSWHRAQGSFVAPLTTRTAVQIDQFTDFDARFVTIDAMSDNNKHTQSMMQSWRTGVRFNLPLDGKGSVPTWLGGFDDETGKRLIQHVMNWSMTLAARPVVFRRGSYGEPGVTATGRPSTWFATDRPGLDDNIQPIDFMKQYEIVTFSTSHRWKIFSELWKTLYGERTLEKPEENSKMSFQEKARRELLYSMDRPVRDANDLFSNDQSQWFANRYQLLETDYIEPVSFGASISYDRLNDLRRRKEGSTRENRPWSELDSALGLSVSGWSINGSSKYNIYDKLQTRFASNLVPPTLWDTNLTVGYTIERNPYQNSTGEITFSSTRERSTTIVTSLMRPFAASWSYSNKDIESADDDSKDYRQKLGLSYASPSGCWGASFVREKPYGSEEKAATYLLQLNVTFMGQTRDLPNMSPPLERQIKKS
jgi:lipopolysaccharide assembly outer membrane protein LptD (OstA)